MPTPSAPARTQASKENVSPSRQRTSRQRKPSQKVHDRRVEEAAAAKHAQTVKVKKAQRALRRVEDSDDDADLEDDVQESNPFTSRSVTSKAAAIKNKVLAQREAQTTAVMPVRVAVDDGLGDSSGDDDEDRGRTAKRFHGVHRSRSSPAGQYGDIPLDFPDSPAIRDTSIDIRQSPSIEEDISAVSKRRASSTDSLRITKIPKTSSGRPKAGDYDDTLKRVILIAAAEFRCNISTVKAFPDSQQEHEMLGLAWEEACERIQLDVPSLTPSMAKLITSRGSHLRGELKTKTRPLVETFYGFESGLNRKSLLRNREIAEALKEGHGFVYQINDAELANRKGLYQSKLIQKVMNNMWFRNKQDEGIVYSDYFNPFPIPALALVLTAIECCIDEWITGVKTDIPFTTVLYQDVYEDHIRCLERFRNHTQRNGKKLGILDNILLKLYNKGRYHSGAQPLSTTARPTISDDAFAAAVKEYIDDSETETDGENGDASNE